MKRFCLLILFSLFSIARAEVITDGSMGVQTSLSGPDFQITEDLGVQLGNNLFHSFQSFNIDSGQSAIYSGSNSIQNVISRVTGGSPSNINGLIQSTIGNADFYFINPAGVLFGQNAQIDVPAAFHISTANQISFADGNTFSSDPSAANQLSIASPHAFGFTSGQSADIEMDGVQLEFPEERNASFSAANISMSESLIKAPSGSVVIFAAGQEDALLATDDVTSSAPGKINMQYSQLDVSGAKGGDLFVLGGETKLTVSDLYNINKNNNDSEKKIVLLSDSLEMNNAYISSDTDAGGKAGDINVYSTGDISLYNDSYISSSTYGAGNAGLVDIQAQSLYIDGVSGGFNAIISNAETGSSGNAGDVVVDVVGNVEIYEGAYIGSNTYASGDAGYVKIKANNLMIDGYNTDGFTGISSLATGGSSGHAGLIDIEVTDTTYVVDRAQISSNTFSSGDAGGVLLKTQNLQMDGYQADGLTGIISQSSGNGDAGLVSIEAPGEVLIMRGSVVSGSAFAEGNGGSVVMSVGQLLIDRQQSDRGTGILSNANSGSSGNAGEVLIEAETININAGGRIVSNTSSSGDAGQVFVNANQIELNQQQSDFFTGISSNAERGSSGNAGEVLVNANQQLNIFSGAEIGSNTFDQGDAGRVYVSGKNLLIDSLGKYAFTGIFSDAIETSIGNAGEVGVSMSEQILVQNGGKIGSSTFSIGDAGSVIVETQQMTIDGQDYPFVTGVLSNAAEGSSGQAGEIIMNVSEQLSIVNGAEISSNTESLGNAGYIKIQAGSVLLDRQGNSNYTGIFSDAISGSTGNAGDIILDVGNDLTIVNGAWISSNTESKGNAGAIEVSANNINLDVLDSRLNTGIFSDAKADSMGNAGDVFLSANEQLKISSGAQISSSTSSIGSAGSIEINSDSIILDAKDSQVKTGIYSDAKTDSGGEAGVILVNNTGDIEIYNAAGIGTNTYGKGDAGGVIINSNNLHLTSAGTIKSLAGSDSEGNAGFVELNIVEKLSIFQGASVNSSTYGLGHAGDVLIQANNIELSRQGEDALTGIFSNSYSTDRGDAGGVQVTAKEQLNILQGAWISSSTKSAGNAGFVMINADTLNINSEDLDEFTGIASQALSESIGNAGDLQIKSKLLSAINGGKISTDTFGDGNAGSVQIISDVLTLDDQNNEQLSTGVFSNTYSTANGSAGLIDIQANKLSIVSGSSIASNTYSAGDAGMVQIKSEDVLLDRAGAVAYTGIFSDAKVDSTGNAGVVDVQSSGDIAIYDGAWISSNTYAQGNAGDINLSSNNLLINAKDSGILTGVFSNANTGSQGNAGNIVINNSAQISILAGAGIKSNTYATGDAGNIVINTQDLIIDGHNLTYLSDISTNAKQNSNGNGGFIQINASGQLSLLSGALISSYTESTGNAGNIEISSANLLIDRAEAGNYTGISSDAVSGSSGLAGAIQINNKGTLSIYSGGVISSDTEALGNAGDIDIQSENIEIDARQSRFSTGIFSNANTGSQGNAGNIVINNSAQISILAGAGINSNTYAIGDAGSITIQSGQLQLDSQNSEFNNNISSSALSGSSGNAGFVDLTIIGDLKVIDGSEIGSNTQGSGNAGDVVIHAGNLIIDSNGSAYYTGVGSDTFNDFEDENKIITGNAGLIEIQVDGTLAIYETAGITSTSSTAGNAGEIIIYTDKLVIDAQTAAFDFAGITSEAYSGSTGQVGNITISANQLEIKNNAYIGIGTASQLADRTQNSQQIIELQSNYTHLFNGAKISAESSGNADAADIQIDSQTLVLENSLVTTSVANKEGGVEGNGGDIMIKTPVLILHNGFIQANTQAAGASGGDIVVDTPLLIYPANQSIATNQQQRVQFAQNSGLNVIQAAAPDGVSGNVEVTSPELGLSASVLNVSAQFSAPQSISKQPCQVKRGDIPSSLTSLGQGGIIESPSDNLMRPIHYQGAKTYQVPTTDVQDNIKVNGSSCRKVTYAN